MEATRRQSVAWENLRRRASAAAARLTVRERLLLVALGAGALAWIVFGAADRATAARASYAEAVAAHARAQAQASTRGSELPGSTASARLEQLERWVFTAPNTDLAAAEIEERLLRAAADAGLAEARIRLAATVSAEPDQDLVWIPVEIEAPLRWESTFSFLELVSSWTEAHDLTAFSAEIAPLPAGRTRDPAAPFGRVRMEFSFPVQLETGALQP